VEIAIGFELRIGEVSWAMDPMRAVELAANPNSTHLHFYRSFQ